MDNTKPQAMSIDDILSSVRKVIDEKDNIDPDDSPCEELELIDIAQEGRGSAQDESDVIIQKFVESPENLEVQDNKQNIIINSSSDYTATSNANQPPLDTLDPQVKRWLDANLPALVKQIVSEEVKKQLADVNKDSK